MSKAIHKVKASKTTSKLEEGAPRANRKPSQLKRIAIGIALVAGVWLGCILTMDRWVQRAISDRHLTSAIAWSQTLAWFKPWDAELPLMRAKAARLADDMEAWSAQMQPLASQPNGPAVKEELVFGKIMLGDFPDTYHVLMGQMLDAAPAGEVAEAFVMGFLAKHDQENARAVLDAWKRDEPQSAQVQYVEAILEEVVGNRHDATTRLTEFAAAHPQHEPVRARLASLHLADRRYEPAMKELEALSSLGDHSPTTTIRLAQCQRLLGKVEDAKAQLQRMLSENQALESQSALAHREQAQRELAKCQLELGEYADAAKTLRAAGVNHLEPEQQTDLALADYLSGNTQTAETVHDAIAKTRQFNSRRSDLEVYMVLNPQDDKARRELAKLVNASQ